MFQSRSFRCLFVFLPVIFVLSLGISCKKKKSRSHTHATAPGDSSSERSGEKEYYGEESERKTKKDFDGQGNSRGDSNSSNSNLKNSYSKGKKNLGESSPNQYKSGKNRKKSSPSYKKKEYSPEKKKRVASPVAPPRPLDETTREKPNREKYTHHGFRPFKKTAKDALSTFSIDVDTASYTICRRKIGQGTLPPPSSVRVEEFINYFNYSYPAPEKKDFAAHISGAPSPFRSQTYLFQVGLKAREVSGANKKRANLVFLIDTSGSMNRRDKIDLIKKSLRLLVNNLEGRDRIAICTYGGRVSLDLPPTLVEEKEKILGRIDELQAYGSTKMAKGILTAYSYAQRHFEEGGINRVIVCSDGDANVGPKTPSEILKLIGEYRQEGITLTTIGVGQGNYRDTMMEQLANRGNGNYHYIDDLRAARKIFGRDLISTLQVVAFDTKIQVEFNPSLVERYRLVGYENRKLKDRDFRDDKVDAGEVGAGHSVTAIYEVELTSKGKKIWEKGRQKSLENLLTFRLRYGKTARAKSRELNFSFQKAYGKFSQAPYGFRLAAIVAETAEVLRKSPYAKRTNLKFVRELARTSLDKNTEEERDFLNMLDQAIALR